MLDFDLAELYGTETKYLKRAVKNNIRRFPSDFMFELTKEEFDDLRCNFSTSKRGGIRYMLFAFTEHGVAQLSSVLNSDIAIEVNLQIIRAFIVLRQLVYPSRVDTISELRQEMKKLEEYIKEVLTDQNDINDIGISFLLINALTNNTFCLIAPNPRPRVLY